MKIFENMVFCPCTLFFFCGIIITEKRGYKMTISDRIPASAGTETPKKPYVKIAENNCKKRPKSSFRKLHFFFLEKRCVSCVFRQLYKPERENALASPRAARFRARRRNERRAVCSHINIFNAKTPFSAVIQTT